MTLEAAEGPALVDRPRLGLARHPFSKVPEITAVFWVIKILTTATGEAFSDFMDHHFGPAVAVLVGIVGIAGGMRFQFKADRYRPWTYWGSITAVAVFGTMAADGVHVVGVPYIASTAFYAIVLGLIFRAWYRREGTLSIHSIYTLHRERFYWATVLATFALGTAAGDMTASTLHLGFLISGIAFAVLFALPGLAYWRGVINPIAGFWIAYVLTRPLGASFADWLSSSNKGLGLGTGWVSLIFGLGIVAGVTYLAITHEDVEEEHGAHA